MSTEDTETHYDLGFAYAEMGLLVDALSELEIALRLDPNHPRAESAQKQIEVLRGELGLPPPPSLETMRERWYDPAEESDSENRESEMRRWLLQRADHLATLEHYGVALAIYERVANQHHASGDAMRATAIYRQMAAILRDYRPDLERRYAHIYENLGDVPADMGQPQDEAQAHGVHVSNLLAAGYRAEARRELKKLLELGPLELDEQQLAAESFVALGDVNTAVDLLGKTARALLSEGNRDEAIRVLERLLECRAEPKYARMAAELYLDRNGLGDAKAAHERLHVCVLADPDDATIPELMERASKLVRDHGGSSESN